MMIQRLHTIAGLCLTTTAVLAAGVRAKLMKPAPAISALVT